MTDTMGWQPGDPVYPETPPATRPRDRRVDLEHLPAQRLAAAGDSEGAQWVYDAAAELARLRARVAELETIEQEALGLVSDDVAREILGEGSA